MDATLVSVRVTDKVNTSRGMAKVIIMNDDTTPMEVVVICLASVFEKNYDDSIKLMATAHTRGSAVVGVYPKKLAITKQKKAMQLVHSAGYHDFTVNVEEVGNEG